MTRALALFLLLVAALVPARGALAQAKGADARLAALIASLDDDKNPTARNEAYQTLWREKPAAAVPLLLAALPRFGVAGQELGLGLVSMYPAEASEPALRKLLASSSALLEAGAAATLWRSGARDVLEHLVQPFARKGLASAERRALLNRVYAIREPRLSAAIRAWLAPECEPALLEDACYQLVLAEDGEVRARAAELASANGAPPALRVACGAALLALGDESLAAEVAAALRADEGAALARLQRFLLRAPHLGEELRAALAKLAEESRTPLYAQMAILVLGQHAGPKEVPVLERLLDHASPIVSKAALEALQKRGGGISREVLARMLAAEDGARALAAADALRREDDLSGLERVLGLARAAGAQRAEALRVLARFRCMRCVPVLLDALADADPAARAAAETGLLTLLPNLFPYRRFDLASSGYSAQGSAEARAAGLQKLRAWWDANGRK